MKTKLFFPVIGCILMLITSSSFSQVTTNYKELHNDAALVIPNAHIMELGTNPSTNVSVAVNNKVQKAFVQYFAGAAKQNWSMAGKNFHSSFYVNGLLTEALFEKSGNLIYAVTFGTEKDFTC